MSLGATYCCPHCDTPITAFGTDLNITTPADIPTELSLPCRTCDTTVTATYQSSYAAEHPTDLLADVESLPALAAAFEAYADRLRTLHDDGWRIDPDGIPLEYDHVPLLTDAAPSTLTTQPQTDAP